MIENKNSRIHFVIDCKDTNDTFGLIFLEIDEHQHNGYTIFCELSRMCKILESLTIDGNNVPIHFIRYNPHNYMINGIKQNISQSMRHHKLLEILNTTHFDVPFKVQYLFYDMMNGKPSIMNDPDYAESFKEFVI